MKTAKLNQIIAVEKGIKSQVMSDLSQMHKVNQKAELFNGFDKQYKPKDEEGEKMPAEAKRVQYLAKEVLRGVERSLSSLMQVTARKDWTNCTAKADVVVDKKVLLAGVPITYLLFLEKNVTDIRTFVANLPVLDPSEDWNYDSKSELFKTDPVQTQKTSKQETPVVLYDATEHHPAQTAMVTKDIVIGYWNTVKHSGAFPMSQKKELLERVEKLLVAIKEAREEANTIEEVQAPNVGEAIFGYLLPQAKKED